MNDYSQCTALFVDDEASVLTSLKRLLIRESYQQLFAGSAAEGLEMLQAHDIQVVVSDVRMPEMDGLRFLQKVREQYPNTIRMILSGTPDITRVVEAINSGEVYRYLTKPLNEPLNLKATLRQSFDYHNLQQQRRILLQNLEEKNQELGEWNARVSKEMKLAAILQQQFMDTHTYLDDHRIISKLYKPSLYIGGDVFDLARRTDDRVVIYVADVCGHGVASALVAFMMKAIIRDVIHDPQIKQLHEMANEIHHRFGTLMSQSELFITLLLVLFNPSTNRYQGLCCGHPDPLKISGEGPQVLNPDHRGGLPVGVMDVHDDPYTIEDAFDFDLKRDEMLVLYTDGITEARHPENQAMCGETELGDACAQIARNGWASNPCCDVIQRIEQKGYVLDNDDCSLLILMSRDAEKVLVDENMTLAVEAIELTASRVHDTLLQESWSKEAAVAARLVIQEYGLNLMGYAGTEDPLKVRLQVCLRAQCCMIVFHDNGAEWDFCAQLDYAQRAELDRERGRGLILIDGLTSECDVYHVDDETIGYFVVPRYGRDPEKATGTAQKEMRDEG